jgi:hypothetical protein
MHRCLEGGSEARIQCTNRISSIPFSEYIFRSVYSALTDCIISVVGTVSLSSKTTYILLLDLSTRNMLELVLKLNSEISILGRFARCLISSFHGFPLTQQVNCLQTLQIHHILYATYSSLNVSVSLRHNSSHKSEEIETTPLHNPRTSHYSQSL